MPSTSGYTPYPPEWEPPVTDRSLERRVSTAVPNMLSVLGSPAAPCERADRVRALAPTHRSHPAPTRSRRRCVNRQRHSFGDGDAAACSAEVTNTAPVRVLEIGFLLQRLCDSIREIAYSSSRSRAKPIPDTISQRRRVVCLFHTGFDLGPETGAVERHLFACACTNFDHCGVLHVHERDRRYKA